MVQKAGVFSGRLGGMTSKETVVCARLWLRSPEEPPVTGAVREG